MQPKHAASKGIIAAWQQRKQLYYQVPNGPSNAIDEASLLLPLPDDAEQERIEVTIFARRALPTQIFINTSMTISSATSIDRITSRR
jgi:hypothetical protein